MRIIKPRKDMMIGESPLVSVIVINSGDWADAKRSLGSLRGQDRAKIEALFIDNGRPDSRPSKVTSEWPGVTVIETDSDLGFCRAANQAAEICSGRFILFLETGTWIKDGALEKLVETVETEPRCGIAGPLLLNEDRTLRSVGMKIDLLGQPMANKELFGADTETVDNVFFVPGSAMLVDKELFWALDGFDERYYSQLADADLCWRARLLGHRVVINPWAIAFCCRPEADRDVYLNYRNSLRMIIKNYSLARAAAGSVKFIAVTTAEAAKALVMLEPRLFTKYLKALAWNLAMLPNSINQRRRIQRGRQEDDEMVLRGAMIEEEKLDLSSPDRAA